MTTSERIQKRKHRLNLTYHLSKLEQTYCDPCEKNNQTSEKERVDVCKGCTVYDEIRAIGLELMGGEVIKTGRKGRKPLDISLVEYHDLKSSGLNDTDIAKRLKISTRSLANFKRANGLSIKRNVSTDKLEGNNEKL